MLEALEFVNIAGVFRIHAKKSRTGGAGTRPGWPGPGTGSVYGDVQAD